MSVTADFARGSSGAPIFDGLGNVVGMVASTISVYYDDEDGRQKNLQMVLKNCVPARCILDLIDQRPVSRCFRRTFPRPAAGGVPSRVPGDAPQMRKDAPSAP